MASAALTSSIAAAAAEESAATERMIREMKAETESERILNPEYNSLFRAQRLMNVRTAKLEEEMKRAAIQQKLETNQVNFRGRKIIQFVI